MTATQQPIRLLHVDDDPMFLETATAFLERSDVAFDIDPVNDPTNALDCLSEATYDAIVSDHDMPGTSGLELLQRVRQSHPDLPFVLFTGKGSEEVASEAIAMGVSDYLQKGSPDTYRLLANRVANLVRQYRAEVGVEQYAEQQRLVATLGQVALEDDIESLFDAVVTGLVDGLAVEYAKILEYRPTHDDCLLRAGVGWSGAVVGETTVGIDQNSQAGYTLQSEVPVIVTELGTEERFSGPELLETHGIVSGISVIIGSPDDPWGVLGVHSTEQRVFNDEDVNFVQNVANLLSATIDRYTYRSTIETQQTRLSLLVEESPLGIIQSNPDFEIVAVNPMAEEILGYPEAELIGEPWEILITKSSRAKLERTANSLLDGSGGEWNIDENVRKDGEHILCEWHNRVATDDSGVVAIFSLFQDVTERQRQREELELQADLFEKSQAIANVGAWEWDVVADDGFWTSGVSRIYGLPDDDDGGTVEKGLSMYHPEDRPKIEAAFYRAIEAGIEYDLKLRVVRPDGELRWVRTRGEPQYVDGELVRVRGTVQDITDSKVREMELSATVDQLQQFYEVSNSAKSFEEKLDEVLRLWCDAFDLSYGYLTEIHPGDGASEGTLQITYAVGDHDEIQTGASYPLDEAYCRKTIERESELVLQDVVAEGWEDDPAYQTTELGSYAGTKVHVGSELYGTLCFASTEAREEPFSEVELALFRLVGLWAGHELERTRLDAARRQKTERLEAFTDVVSHDLRNPLNVAQGYLSLAEESGDPAAFERCQSALDRMEELIENLLSLAQQRKRPVEMETVDLAKMAATCWSVVATDDASLVVERGTTLTGDQSRLQQLFENLFRNAIEHAGDSLTVRVGCLDDESGIYVEDDGVGIAVADQQRVFDFGFSSGGTGIGFGLAIVETIVEEHGWEIRVTESAAGGARFEIVGPECTN